MKNIARLLLIAFLASLAPALPAAVLANPGSAPAHVTKGKPTAHKPNKKKRKHQARKKTAPKKKQAHKLSAARARG